MKWIKTYKNTHIKPWRNLEASKNSSHIHKNQ